MKKYKVTFKMYRTETYILTAKNEDQARDIASNLDSDTNIAVVDIDDDMIDCEVEEIE
jgi:hypothetical protein